MTENHPDGEIRESSLAPGSVEVALHAHRDGIARIELAGPRREIVLTIEALREIDLRLAEVEPLARSGEVEVLVVGTGGAATDVGGYDPAELRLLDEEDLVAWSHEGQVILGRLEELPIPTIADVAGRWSGAGLELALACSYRVALPGDSTGFAMPQRHLGLIPAWGGTVRLPRLVGLGDGLGMIVAAEPVGAEEAKAMGLIDTTMPVLAFAERLRSFEARRPLKDRRSGWGRKGLRRRLLEQTLPGRPFAVRRADRRSRGAGPIDPISREARSLIVENAAAPIPRALANESAAVGRLAGNPIVRGRLHASWALDRARAEAESADPLPESAAVVGAGQTGGDIAHLLVTAGIRVRLKDSRRERLREGIHQAHRRLSWERAQGRISEAQAGTRSGQIAGGSGFGGFGTVDLLVAAADGTTDGAAELLRSSEPHVRAECVMAYHDWTTGLDSVAAALSRPERVIGITPHFPADRFPLLEISTTAATTRRALDFATRLSSHLGLVAIRTGPAAPTPGIRLLGAYLAEGLRLVAEGARVDQVDDALESFGFAVGPFRRIDAVGAPRVLRMLDALGRTPGSTLQPPPLLSTVAKEAGTFYRYRNGVPVAPSRDLAPGLSPDRAAVGDLVLRRVLLLLGNEAGRILGEFPFLEPSVVDATALLALGYPRDHGGPLFHADQRGLARFATELERAASRWGDRYAPAPRIIEIVSSEGSIFPEAGPGTSGHRRTPVLT